MKSQLRESLLFYGYAKIPGIEHDTAFFEFDDLTTTEIAQNGEFRKLNKRILETIGSTEWDGTTFRCNEEIVGECNIEEWKTILSLPTKLQIKERK
jgi:hypothetical protein